VQPGTQVLAAEVATELLLRASQEISCDRRWGLLALVDIVGCAITIGIRSVAGQFLLARIQLRGRVGQILLTNARARTSPNWTSRVHTARQRNNTLLEIDIAPDLIVSIMRQILSLMVRYIYNYRRD